MAKEIYIGTANDHVNKHLSNLMTNEQIPVWDESELLIYKSIYPISKAWLLLELQHSHLSQQINHFIEGNFNLINDKKQQIFTFEPSNIIPNPANTFGSIHLIYQSTIASIPAQMDVTPPADLPQQPSNPSVNLYIQIPPIKVPNEMLPAIIIAQFVKIWDRNSNYTGKAYDILDDKIKYFLDICYIVVIK